MKVFLISALCNLGFRVVIAYILSNFIGEHAIWWALPIGWIIGYLVAYIRYRSKKWVIKLVE